MSLGFEWDPRKAAVNLRKHGVSFQNAQSVFTDERARLIDDPDHSADEDRFLLLGLSSSVRLLVVAHRYREAGGRHSHHLRALGRARGTTLLSIGDTMRKQYDFSASRKNPYASQLKEPVTIRLDEQSITYCKSMSAETGIPYQSLINLYLKECAASGKKLNLAWK